jgi:hypothetical protein
MWESRMIDVPKIFPLGCPVQFLKKEGHHKINYFFDGSFWYGLVEYEERDKIQALKHVCYVYHKKSNTLWQVM